MAKNKERCQHGNSPVYMQGCPHCVQDAMRSLGFLRDNKMTLKELWYLMHHVFKTQEQFEDALRCVRERIETDKAKVCAMEGGAS